MKLLEGHHIENKGLTVEEFNKFCDECIKQGYGKGESDSPGYLNLNISYLGIFEGCVFFSNAEIFDNPELLLKYSDVFPEENQKESEVANNMSVNLTNTVKIKEEISKIHQCISQINESKENIQKLVGDLSEELGVKLKIVDAMLDEDVLDLSKLNSKIPEGVDVNDPKTWEEHDVIRCVSTESMYVTIGKLYEFDIWSSTRGVGVVEDDEGDPLSPVDTVFEFVSRPNSKL